MPIARPMPLCLLALGLTLGLTAGCSESAPPADTRPAAGLTGGKRVDTATAGSLTGA